MCGHAAKIHYPPSQRPDPAQGIPAVPRGHSLDLADDLVRMDGCIEEF